MSDEQTFQQLLRIELTRQLGLRVWRQPAGTIPTRKGGYVEAAPEGAADLSGIVAGNGWRVEIECKALRTPTTQAQRHWREWINSQGGIALQVRGPNVDGAVEQIARAVAERGRRG